MRVILEKRGRLGRPAGWRDVMAEKKQSAADKKAAGDKKSALETALVTPMKMEYRPPTIHRRNRSRPS